MIIKIKNYKNIENLNLDLEDNKINFIFGISGCGKTSVGQSLSNSIFENDVMIGKKPEDILISINGEETNTKKIKIYNEDILNFLIVENNMSSNIYDIIFANDNKIMDKKKEFQNSIKELINFKETMCEYIGKIDVLIKNYGGKLTIKNELPATSKIIKYQKAVNNIDNLDYVKVIKSSGNNYLKWINEGTSFELYEENKICPFCEQKISPSRIQLVENLCNVKPKDFDIIFDNTNILQQLNIDIDDYSNNDSINILKNEIINKIKLKDEIINIINVIDYYTIDNYNPSNISAIIISDDFRKTFPQIIKPISNVNKKITEIKRLLGELRQITDKTIHDNLNTLNNYIEKFGIPYKFIKNKYDIDKKTANYILYHIKDKSQTHRTNGLSYGERNIISLLLFLLNTRKDEIVIIDDPASSYDDYRRKIIFDLLYNLHNNNTFIVLSHDMVFVKYAVFNKKQGNNSNSLKLKTFFEKTGRIISFENYNNTISIKDIEFNDFDTIDNQVIRHITNNKLSYYRKIINLRILTESKKNTDSDFEIIYNYLSAILHTKDKARVTDLLKEKGLSEEEVIQKILQKYNIKIDKIPDDILLGFNVDDLTDFEKIFYYRDEIEDENIKDEFNNIIHMNSSYVFALNPYKYNYFSPYVYNIINNK